MRIRPVLQIALGAVLLMPLTEVPGKADGPPYKVTRNVVERSFDRLKQFRGSAIRYAERAV